MKTPHKHAEILRAIADGKEVQFRNRGGSRWFDPEYGNPIANPELEWRVKPEPKPDIVTYANVGSYNGKYSVLTDAYPDKATLTYPNLRLTFDGETGRLKKAEVLE